MELNLIDASIVIFYLLGVAVLGFFIQKKASAKLDNYYLAGRNVPWWMLGIAGCSSYIDIGGTMAMVGALFYLGLKSVWMTHIFWGWFMIAGYMAFQAKWIRRSGVMTFAEWNETRFGKNRDAEMARLVSAIFLLVLMIFNLIYIAVGIGKFAETFFPIERWQATLIVFGVVGLYVTLAGFYGVIITDMIQTVLIAAGAVLLTVIIFSNGIGTGLAETHPEGWSQLAPSWNLWDGFLNTTPASYQHFELFGPLLFIGFGWMIFRVLAGPNVWDFQFFLSARSPRDAAMAGGMWTVGYTLRWFLGVAFLVLGVYYLGSTTGFDAEKIMPMVLTNLPVGISGLFMAVLLAALMSTLDAMINVTSNVVVNDFIKRYFFKKLGEKRIIRIGQLASVFALLLGFIFSLAFKDIISAWETMLFIVVTMILVPATLRWHWWRYSGKAFVYSMIGTAAFIAIQKVFLTGISSTNSLGVNVLASLIISISMGFIFKPTDREVLVAFYSRIKPFGFWKPIRNYAVEKGLIEAKNREPFWDALNGLIVPVFQFSLSLIPFYLFLRNWNKFWLWLGIASVVAFVLYFTWYRKLPKSDES